MRKMLYICVFCILVIVSVGCTSKHVCKATPDVDQVENEYFIVKLYPYVIMDECTGFRLEIKNKVKNDIEVDWNNVFYVYEGKKNGGIMFMNTRHGDRNNSKPADVIPGYGELSKQLFPSNLSYFSDIAKTTIHEELKPGENGLILAIRVDNKTISETLTLRFSREKK